MRHSAREDEVLNDKRLNYAAEIQHRPLFGFYFAVYNRQSTQATPQDLDQLEFIGFGGIDRNPGLPRSRLRALE